jgi:hypothetical protein
MKPFRQAILTNANIKFEIASNITVNGTTTNYPDIQIIKLNSGYLDKATPISISRTILHEVMHAYLNVWYRNRANGSIENIWQLFEYFFSNGSGQAHHNLMASTYRTYLMESMRNFDLKRNPSISDRPSNFYSNLSWGGLFDTPPYIALDDITKQQIINLLIQQQNAGGCPN